MNDTGGLGVDSLGLALGCLPRIAGGRILFLAIS